MKGSTGGLVFGLFFLFIFSSVSAQSLKVLDANSLEPISDVVAINTANSKLAKSNDNGVIDLDTFQDDELILFQHASYQDLILTKSDALKNKYITLSENIIQIDEVVISANKWEQDLSEIPNSVSKISAGDIAKYNPQTAADALANTGQIFVQKSQLGGGSPMIRGFSANSVLISVDGVRMNNAIFRGGNLQNVISVDPNAIEQTEVIFGPGSVIYGSDALGGVMDFHVKSPELAKNDNTLIDGSALTRYSSANNELTGHLQLNVGNKRFAWFGSYTYSRFDDLRSGSVRTSKFPDYGKRFEYVIRQNNEDIIVPNDNENRMRFSGFDAWSTVQRLKFRASENIDLTYSFYYSNTTDFPRYDRLIEYREGLPRNAQWYYGPQKWMMNNLKLNIYKSNKAFDEGRIVIANQQFEESRHDRRFQSDNLRHRTENVDVWTLNADFDRKFNEENQVFYGIEGVYNNVKSTAFQENIVTRESAPTSTRYPDGGSDVYSFSAYGAYKHNWNESLILSAGARYNYYNLESRFVDTTFFNFPFDEININNNSIIGNLGLVYKSINDWKFDFLISSGFRSPNVDDVGKVFDSEPGNVVVPNEDLGPEYAFNGEVTVSKTILGKFTFGITTYYTRLIDAMVRRDFTFNGQDSIIYDGTLSKVQAIVNTGEAYIFGVSGNVIWAFAPYWNFKGSINYTDGRDMIEDVPLRHAPPLFGSASVEFQKNKWRFELYTRYQNSRSFEDLAPSEQSKAFLYTDDGALGWYTINLMANYTINRNLKIDAGVENILDKHYIPYASGISAPGRNFIISLRLFL